MIFPGMTAGGKARVGVLLGLALVMGSGCDRLHRPEPAPPPATTWKSPAPLADIAIVPKRKPAAPAPVRRVRAVETPPPAAEVPPASETAGLLPVRGLDIRGFSETQTRLMLGPPAEERLRVPSKVWRYSVSQCSVDVFLSLDLEKQAYRVLDTSIVRADAPDMLPGRCLGLIQEAHRAQS